MLVWFPASLLLGFRYLARIAIVSFGKMGKKVLFLVVGGGTRVTAGFVSISASDNIFTGSGVGAFASALLLLLFAVSPGFIVIP